MADSDDLRDLAIAGICISIFAVAVTIARWLDGRKRTPRRNCEAGIGLKSYAIFVPDALLQQAQENPMTVPQPKPKPDEWTTEVPPIQTRMLYINPRLICTYPDDESAEIAIGEASIKDKMSQMVNFEGKEALGFRVFGVSDGAEKEICGIERILCHDLVDSDIKEALESTGRMTVIAEVSSLKQSAFIARYAGGRRDLMGEVLEL
ncbi:hypothetical protein FDECE_14303 [Fusarium decemcellulare]|nr:hypothetical protein FDECE_14303 [Fusarium decemcellulare]